MYEDPDTRLATSGPCSLGDAELLSFLLTRGGAPGQQALDTARRLLEAAGDLPRLAAMGEGELVGVPGIGPVRARRVVAVAALGRRIAERPWPRGASYGGPREVYESVRGRLGKARTEVFAAILLDGRMRKLREVELCRGGRNAVSVLPRDVLEPALREGASAVILVHNHPSGDPAPSEQDVALTQRMAAAAELLGLAVTDHVIVGDGRYASMAELGLFEPAAAPGEGTSWASARGAARALRGSSGPAGEGARGASSRGAGR